MLNVRIVAISIILGAALASPTAADGPCGEEPLQFRAIPFSNFLHRTDLVQEIPLEVKLPGTFVPVEPFFGDEIASEMGSVWLSRLDRVRVERGEAPPTECGYFFATLSFSWVFDRESRKFVAAGRKLTEDEFASALEGAGFENVRVSRHDPKGVPVLIVEADKSGEPVGRIAYVWTGVASNTIHLMYSSVEKSPDLNKEIWSEFTSSLVEKGRTGSDEGDPAFVPPPPLAGSVRDGHYVERDSRFSFALPGLMPGAQLSEEYWPGGFSFLATDDFGRLLQVTVQEQPPEHGAQNNGYEEFSKLLREQTLPTLRRVSPQAEIVDESLLKDLKGGSYLALVLIPEGSLLEVRTQDDETLRLDVVRGVAIFRHGDLLIQVGVQGVQLGEGDDPDDEKLRARLKKSLITLVRSFIVGGVE